LEVVSLKAKVPDEYAEDDDMVKAASQYLREGNFIVSTGV